MSSTIGEKELRTDYPVRDKTSPFMTIPKSKVLARNKIGI